MTFPSWPFYDQDELEAASAVLASGKVNAWTGNQNSLFETEFASWCGSKYALTFANGSLALSAAYLALGLQSGDEVITTPRTFIATASMASNLGIRPIFADVDINSGNITATSIEPLISRKTKAICLVHLAGWPADMDPILTLAKAHNLPVIEDCAQAHGAFIGHRSVGSFGTIGCWSFCQDKIISTAGEGGMITTSDEKLMKRLWSLRDHGKSYDLVHNYNPPARLTSYRWLHQEAGSNLRLTEFQSAIGRRQLSKLPSWSSSRASNAQYLITQLSPLPYVRIPQPPLPYLHAWYKLHLYIQPDKLSTSWNRSRIIAEIQDLGFPAFQGSCSEIYLEKYFVDKGLAPSSRLKNAQTLGQSSIMLLVHPTINTDSLHAYCEAVKTVLIKAFQ